MDVRKILADLKSERNRIDEAIRAIESLGGTGNHTARRGRPASKTSATSAKPRRRPRMSAAARKKLSEMMKKRWASGKMGRRKKTA